MIPVFRPEINKEAVLIELAKIFDSGWVGLGPKVAEFEEMFAAYIGTKYAVAVNSCTAALHLANVVIGIKSGDEVIVPSMTFVSTALAPLYCGATPVFADVEEDTLCIDPADIKRKITSKTKAVIPVHFGGHACKMNEITEIANTNGLYIIEDVAHACGGKYYGQMLGSIGIAGCFSFHAVKNLATGDGGMITTNDERIYKELKKLRWVGIDKDTWCRNGKRYSWQYTVDSLGFKYHMNDITAVIGIEQLKLLNKHNSIRREWVRRYNKALKDVNWIKTPVENDYAYIACHNYVIQTPVRDELNEYLASKGISTGVHYEPCHHFKVFNSPQICVPVTERIWTNLLTLPLYSGMTEDDFEIIINAIKSYNDLIRQVVF